jgi:hypothetical protein
MVSLKIWLSVVVTERKQVKVSIWDDATTQKNSSISSGDSTVPVIVETGELHVTVASSRCSPSRSALR